MLNSFKHLLQSNREASQTQFCTKMNMKKKIETIPSLALVLWGALAKNINSLFLF